MQEEEDEEIPEWAITPDMRRKQRYPVTVFVSVSMRSDVSYITFTQDMVMTVGALKMRVVDVLHMRKERVGVYAEGDLLCLIPEWEERVPRKVKVEDLLASPTPEFRYVDVYHIDAKEDFIIRMHTSMINDDVRLMVAGIVCADAMQI